MAIKPTTSTKEKRDTAALNNSKTPKSIIDALLIDKKSKKINKKKNRNKNKNKNKKLKEAKAATQKDKE